MRPLENAAPSQSRAGDAQRSVGDQPVGASSQPPTGRPEIHPVQQCSNVREILQYCW